MSEPDAGPSRPRSLVRAFAALASSQLVGTASGFAFWVLVARSADPVDVGVAGAVVATAMLLTRLTSLGLGSFLMVELPRLGWAPARDLLRLATVVLVGVAGAAALAWTLVVLVLRRGADPATGSSMSLVADSAGLAAAFVAIVVLTAVTSAWDYGALGLDQGSAQVVRVLVASLGRFPVLLLWPVVVGDVGAGAILAAWLLPLALSAVVLAARVRLLGGVRREREPGERARDLLRHHWRTSLGHYAIDVALAAGPLLVPVVAAGVLDPEDNGFFTVAWMAAGVVFVVPFALATALFASNAGGGSAAFLRSSRRVLPAGLGLALGGCVGTWLVGPWAFRVFGADYVERSLPLTSVMVLASLAMVLKDLLLDWLRLGRRFALAASLAATSTTLDVTGALVGGLVTGDATGLVRGWVVAAGLQVVVSLPWLATYVRGVVAAPALTSETEWRGLLGWGLHLLAVLLRLPAPTRPLRASVGRLQWRYLDWPLQRLALARLTRRQDQRWWDDVPATLAPLDQPAFFGGRDAAEAMLAGLRAGFYPMPEPTSADRRLRRRLLDLRGLPWHCPDPRAVTPAGAATANKSLRRTLRACGWTSTLDAAFPAVLEVCSRPEADNHWLTPAHRRTWLDLHARGDAHSLEVWDGQELVGGLFGAQTGGVFYVASLFHTRSNASKVADLDLNARLAAAGGVLVDAGGFWYDYFESVGVQRISRAEFLDTLRRTRDDDIRLEAGPLPVARLLDRLAPVVEVRGAPAASGG